MLHEYNLFIDELGVFSLKDKNSSIYVLCGCAVKNNLRNELKVLADQIKFKYWGRTDVVFHSKEIGGKDGMFSIFKKDGILFENFINDLLKFLNDAHIILFPVVIDKEQAINFNWNDIKILSETSQKVVFHFLNFLVTQKESVGRITVESATSEKDVYYLRAFSYFLSPNSLGIKVNYKELQKILTSISFVTKNNYDIEEQIADLFAYAIKCKYLQEYKKYKFDTDSYEFKIVSILEKKLFKIRPSVSKNKKVHLSQIESFCILPKK